jgi:pre-rRNA-processing protein TSR1
MFATVKESLQSENIPDPMESEQTWPTEEELVEAEEESRSKKRRIKKVPRGMSEYQAAWIPDSDAGEIY